MVPESAVLGPDPAVLARPAAPLPIAGDPGLACACLEAGDVAHGMPEALRWLATLTAPQEPQQLCGTGTAPADAQLLRRLHETPFLRAARNPAYGYPGDPALLDVALDLAPPPADTTPLGLAMHRWLVECSSTFAAFRARRRYLAACIDRAAARFPGAPVVGLFAGHARELEESRAWRESRVAVQLVDFDARVLAHAREALGAPPRLATRSSTLAELLGGRLPLADCALVYAPLVAEHLPDNTLAQLLEALVPLLRPQGEIVLPTFTRLPEPGLLEHAADWQPNTRSRLRLQRLARDLEDVAVAIHEEPPLGLAYVHVQRHPRHGQA